VIVFDEPTTGLDVVTQAGIIEEIRRLRDERGAAMAYGSHDLAVVAALADRIMVVHAGRVVEHGLTAALVQTPRHPVHPRSHPVDPGPQPAAEADPDAWNRRRNRPLAGGLPVRASLPAAG
jgi:ABC-type glutathione transport system ATPase component